MNDRLLVKLSGVVLACGVMAGCATQGNNAATTPEGLLISNSRTRIQWRKAAIRIALSRFISSFFKIRSDARGTVVAHCADPGFAQGHYGQAYRRRARSVMQRDQTDRQAKSVMAAVAGLRRRPQSLGEVTRGDGASSRRRCEVGRAGARQRADFATTLGEATLFPPTRTTSEAQKGKARDSPRHEEQGRGSAGSNRQRRAPAPRRRSAARTSARSPQRPPRPRKAAARRRSVQRAALIFTPHHRRILRGAGDGEEAYAKRFAESAAAPRAAHPCRCRARRCDRSQGAAVRPSAWWPIWRGESKSSSQAARSQVRQYRPRYFDDVMKAIEPRAAFQVENPPERSRRQNSRSRRLALQSRWQRFQSGRAEVVAQIDPLRRLLEARSKLADLRNKLAGNAQARRCPAKRQVLKQHAPSCRR